MRATPCLTHPHYKGKKAPRRDCDDCWSWYRRKRLERHVKQTDSTYAPLTATEVELFQGRGGR